MPKKSVLPPIQPKKPAAGVKPLEPIPPLKPGARTVKRLAKPGGK